MTRPRHPATTSCHPTPNGSKTRTNTRETLTSTPHSHRPGVARVAAFLTLTHARTWEKGRDRRHPCHPRHPLATPPRPTKTGPETGPRLPFACLLVVGALPTEYVLPSDRTAAVRVAAMLATGLGACLRDWRRPR